MILQQHGAVVIKGPQDVVGGEDASRFVCSLLTFDDQLLLRRYS